MAIPPFKVIQGHLF